MATRDILYAAAGGSAAPTYIEDVFSTYLYTGNGSTQTITNGIDLAGKGGMVWTKLRNAAPTNNWVYSTAQGTGGTGLITNTTDSNTIYSTYNNIQSFNANGFTLGTATNGNQSNQNGYSFVSWTFRKQPKFFDVVTYTGDGTTNRQVNHNLGSVPGMLIIKRTDSTSDWFVLCRNSSGGYEGMYLNKTDASLGASGSAAAAGLFSTYFDPDEYWGASLANINGATYVAYLFAHNAGGFGLTGTDNVISCGSFTTDGSGKFSVNLGYEPQYILLKQTTAVDSNTSWYVMDVMRGFSQTQGITLFPNTNAAETDYWGQYITPTATGFYSPNGATAGATYIYMAIRRGPMKTPTSGTSVFSPIISSASVNTKLTTGFPVDSQWGALRNGDSDNFQVIDRLRKISTTTTENNGSYLRTSTTNAESTATTSRSNFWDNTGFRMFSSWEGGNTLFYNFRRAPGFFDQVCYTGTGSVATQTHNLGVAPELMIVKRRSTSGTSWFTYSSATGNTNALLLDTTDAAFNATAWNNTTPTSSVFSLGTSAGVNGSGSTYVAYLFATLAGVSKVGSYTGTGATQTINAGLPTGARFVLIKRTDSTGNWWVWDTARGMVAGTDPRLATNDGLVGIGEINENWVYTVTNGFQIVTSDATVNASGGSYIYLAIA